MKSLIAKFKVGSVTDFGNNNHEVKMTPVVSGSEENKSFSMYTPSGDCRLHITNPNAIGFFSASDECYVIFVKKENEIEELDGKSVIDLISGNTQPPQWVYKEALELIDRAYNFITAKGMANVEGTFQSLRSDIRNFRNYKDRP